MQILRDDLQKSDFKELYEEEIKHIELMDKLLESSLKETIEILKDKKEKPYFKMLLKRGKEIFFRNEGNILIGCVVNSDLQSQYLKKLTFIYQYLSDEEIFERMRTILFLVDLIPHN